MKILKNPKLILGLIILLFLVTRLYKISEIPSTLYWDEASIAYNAYSVMKDGKDEWGEFLPLHFRAFGEFKLPVYIYSVSFTEIFFDISTFSVRLPAVLFSVCSIILIYLFSLHLYKDKVIALLSSLFFSIFPWYFIFSRTGYEATVGLAFFLLGLYLFILSLKNPKILVISTLSFIVAIYSYNSFRIIIPITFALFAIFSFRHFFRNKIITLLSLLILGLSLIPVINLNRFDSGTSRFEAVKIEKISDFPVNYLSHFEPSFLFLTGDSNPRSQLPGMGQLYLWAVPFLFLGLYKILRKPSFHGTLPLIFLILAPIPAAITKESPHALRTITAIPFFAIITAVGIVFLSDHIRNRWYIVVFLIPFILSFGFYYFAFFNFYNSYSNSWQYGYNLFFQRYKDKFSEYDNVIVTESDAQAYIFALYNLKYDPKRFREEVKYNPPNRWGFSTVERFNKFKFEKVIFENLPHGKSLVLVRNDEPLENLEVKEFIQNINAEGGYFVYEVNK